MGKERNALSIGRKELSELAKTARSEGPRQSTIAFDEYTKRRAVGLGKKVYIPVYDQIVEESVGYKGKDAFIIEGYEDVSDEFMRYEYADEGTEWFRKLKDAKAYMERKNGRKMRFKEHTFYASTGRYWEEEE